MIPTPKAQLSSSKFKRKSFALVDQAFRSRNVCTSLNLSGMPSRTNPHIPPQNPRPPVIKMLSEVCHATPLLFLLQNRQPRGTSTIYLRWIGRNKEAPMVRARVGTEMQSTPAVNAGRSDLPSSVTAPSFKEQPCGASPFITSQ